MTDPLESHVQAIETDGPHPDPETRLREIKRGLEPMKLYLAGDLSAGREPWTREQAIEATRKYTEAIEWLLEERDRLQAQARDKDRSIDIVFDGPPGPEAGRFIEVESPPGKSISFGSWVHRDDGYWVLRFRNDEAELQAIRALVSAAIRQCSGNPHHTLPELIDAVAAYRVVREQAGTR